ncbi:hypothetical protein DAEQUDRAFT_370484 [Daedalea quercina L-15889]|uniref:Uncharacterized protein n=1 Tax=Daedalea quercina L-15889 TaxID=1314783 RepID=A0A165PB87_9APHY|nr:hypothetical protein DAEQUDRAFT_370484 [Daedalea quercina L-15889]
MVRLISYDEQMVKMLEPTAAALASKLACQNVKLWLLQRLSHGGAWVPVLLIRPAPQDGDWGLRVEMDPASDGVGAPTSLVSVDVEIPF